MLWQFSINIVSDPTKLNVTTLPQSWALARLAMIRGPKQGLMSVTKSSASQFVPTNQPANQTIQPVNQTPNESTIHPINQPINQSTN